LNARERIRATLEHRVPEERIGFHDQYWEATVNRWHQEGLPEGVGPNEFFDTDVRMVGSDNSFRLPTETVEETDEYILDRDSWGILKRNWRDHRSTPELLDFAIKERAQWDELKQRLEPDAQRLAVAEQRPAYERGRREGKFIAWSSIPGYEATWRKLGVELLLEAMLTDPEWIVEMYQYDTELQMANLKGLLQAGFRFDGAWFWDDLGYRNGLLFSPRVYRQQLKPCHQKLFDLCHENDMPVILHSCGNVKEIIPDLIEIGLDCLQPLEVKAGMDVLELKAQYGDRLTLMGNIDARVISGEGYDDGALEREIATKVGQAKVGGGYIYHSDHSIPNTVSFERYQQVMALVRQYGAY
jgi:uroporphyrinogen decarboxylase